MRRVTIVLLLALAACGKHSDRSAAQAATKPVALPSAAAGQSAMPAKPAEMKMIPIPKDKAQLARLLTMGYTVHNDHMHPPGVKSCPFDKNGGSIVD